MFMLPLFLSAMDHEKEKAIQDLDTMLGEGEITDEQYESMMQDLLDEQSPKAEHGSQSTASQIAADAAEKRMPKWLKPQTQSSSKISPALDPVEQLKAKKAEIINAIDALAQSSTQINMMRVQELFREFDEMFTAKYPGQVDRQELTIIRFLSKLDTIDIDNFGFACMQIKELTDSNAFGRLT